MVCSNLQEMRRHFRSGRERYGLDLVLPSGLVWGPLPLDDSWGMQVDCLLDAASVLATRAQLENGPVLDDSPNSYSFHEFRANDDEGSGPHYGVGGQVSSAVYRGSHHVSVL